MSQLYSKYFILFSIFFLSFPFFGYQSYQKKISKGYTKTREAQNYSFIAGETQFFDAKKARENKEFIRFILYPLGFISTHDPQLGDAFTINRKCSMLVAGDATSSKDFRDIRAEWLGASSTTNGRISFNADQYSYGMKCIVQIPLPFSTDSFLDNLIIGIRGTLANPTQSLQIVYDDNFTNAERESINTFFSSTTPYAKVNGMTLSNPGFESIALTIEGLYTNASEALRIYYYGGIELPTSSTFSSTVLFYPTLGNNGAIAFCLGAYMHGDIVSIGDNKLVELFIELEDHAPFYKTEERVADLNNKPFSRYLPGVNTKNWTKISSIATVSNLPMRIHPCNDLDISTGISFTYLNDKNDKTILSCGWNIFIASSEYSEIRDRDYKAQYQLFQEYNIAGKTEWTISPLSTIATQYPDEKVAIKNFTINSIDTASVAATGGFTNTLFMRFEGIGSSFIWSLGAWDEFGIKNSSYIMPSRYGIWLGLGGEF